MRGPPFKHEFENLDLPGEVFVNTLPFFEEDITEEKFAEIWKDCDFEIEARKVSEAIERRGKDKDIVFLYHSFGTFIANVFFYLYPEQASRIKGIIELGGAPIQFYVVIRENLILFSQITVDFLYEQAEMVYQGYILNMEDFRKRGIPINVYENKYQAIGIVRLFKSEWFKKMFEIGRHLPKVLKLFCYGSKDKLFTKNLLSEKAMFYCYKNQLDETYEREMAEKYEGLYGQKVKNIQERFVFDLEGAGHSLHMQSQYEPMLKKAIKEYLQMISS